MAAPKPNIVPIMTDQQRADFFASEGFPVDTMPFVESLGRSGTRFSRAYTPIPICSPARTSMLTLRYAKATRVPGADTVPRDGPGIRPHDDRTDFISLVDVMPTLCEAIGAEIPFGCQGRSFWPILAGEAYPAEEFSSIYSEIGFGSLPYGPEERPPLHFPYEGPTYDELNSVTQSGSIKMVRKGDWKLVYELMGRAELYDLAADPGELDNLYDDPAHAARKTEMLEELLYWTVRTEDPLPRAKYLPKTAPRNWYRGG